MVRFILRRSLQMIPTVLGVIVVTFVLFNVVGGSPATLTLGKNVSPKQLEEFDEERGYNKPPIFGWWAKTHAYNDSRFEKNAEAWSTIEGVTYLPKERKLRGRIGLQADRDYEVPLGFELDPNETYRLKLHYRTAVNAEVQLQVCTANDLSPTDEQDESGQVEVAKPAWDIRQSNTLLSKDISKVFGFRKWPTAILDVVPQPGGKVPRLFIRVRDEGMELAKVTLRRKMGRPWDSQFVFYLKQIWNLDFGTSSSTNQPVTKLLRDGIFPSLLLTVPIFIVGLCVTISLSLICAFFRNRFIDRFFVVLAVALMSINYLVFIIGGQYVLAYRLEWFPMWGYESLQFLFLPILIGVISGLGSGLRFYRTVMLDEIYKDYVRTAFAKGVSNKAVLFKHVLKNAMIPIVTNVVIAIPFLYTGSLLLESFFGIPGLGYMGVNAIFSSDVDLLRAIVLIGAVMYVIANLMTDICYALVDPRVTLS